MKQRERESSTQENRRATSPSQPHTQRWGSRLETIPGGSSTSQIIHLFVMYRFLPDDYSRWETRELGSSGPYAMLFCLDDLDKKSIGML